MRGLFPDRSRLRLPSPWRWGSALALAFELAAGAGTTLAWASAGGQDEAVSFRPVVHWRDAGYDWLLVAAADTDEVVVYDAADGRPLRRLGREAGLADVERVVLRDRGLLVLGRDRPRVVRLPQLEVAVAAR
ncbi:hypothetical protein [Frateuria defendens]|uniref:hypothetical protein n=1 Tax=Frateuria defendens TaxID=2219559 RepID=UPI00069DECF2|nr:hypothetical protein [Frateuria defendens]